MAEGKYASANIVPSSDTFREWMDLSNRITYDMEKIVVTTGQVSQPNSSDKVGYVQGNTYIAGIAQANTYAVTTNLRGGTVDTPAVLNISSNVVIGDANTDLMTVKATVHTSGIMPDANATPLGNTTLRWDLVGEDVDLSNSAIIGTQATGIFSNTTLVSVSNTTTNTHLTTAKVAVSNSTVNTSIGRNSVAIGNSTVNTVANTTTIAVVNSTTNTVITRAGVNIGNTTVNAQSNSTSTKFANSTVSTLADRDKIHITGATDAMNLHANAISLRVGNTTVNTQISPTAITSDGTLDVLGASTLRSTLDVTGIATFNANVDLQDSDQLLIGTGDDLAIYHDGSHSYITDGGTGSLKITASQLDILGSGETMATFIDDGAVTLYFNDGAKLATKSDGVDITGELQSDTLDVDGASQLDGTLTVGVDDTGYDVVFHGATAGQKLTWDESADKLIVNGTANVSGTLGVVGAATLSNTLAVTGVTTLSEDLDQANNKEANVYNMTVRNNGTVAGTLGVTGVATMGDDVDITGEVNAATAAIVGAATIGGNVTVSGDIDAADSKEANVYNAVVRNDLTVTGDAALNANTNIPDDKYLRIGTGADMLLYHDQSHSYIEDSGTGSLRLKGTQVDILGTGETMATFVDDGAVTLYHNDSAKIATKSDGVDVTGELQSDSLDVDGAGDISGAVALGSTLAVTGVTTLSEDLDQADNKEANVYNATIRNNTTVGGTLGVTGTTTLSGTVALSKNVSTTANIYSTGDYVLINNSSNSAILRVNELQVTNTYTLPTGGTQEFASLSVSGNTTLGDNQADRITFSGRSNSIMPVGNTTTFGNSTSRWVITANSATLSGDVTATNIYATNDIVANYSSDQFLKDNITVMTDPIDKLKAIRGVKFKWNNLIEDNRVGKTEYGVIAQEVEDVMPSAVATNFKGYKSVNYNHIIALLVEAVKAIEARLETLENS